MPVSKTTCAFYSVAAAGEHAFVALYEWPSPIEGSRPSYGGTLMVHSSYGNFSHSWSTVAKPFKQFLQTLGFDTFASKCLGAAARVFDGSATLANVSAQLETHLANRDITEEQASIIRTILREEGAASAEAFHYAMSNLSEDSELQFTGADDFFAAASDYVGTVANPQAVGFWTDLWPQFMASLADESALST